MAGYTPSGPFNPLAPPGMSAAFLNNIETFLQSINSGATDANISAVLGIMTVLGMKINPTSFPLSGSTSGTATLWQPFQGTFKLVILVENAFRNGSGSAQTISIPVPFTTAFRWWTGDTNTMTFKNGTNTQNVGVITAIGSGGGTGTVQTNVNSYSNGDCFAAVDTISFSGSAGSTHTGVSILAGI